MRVRISHPLLIMGLILSLSLKAEGVVQRRSGDEERIERLKREVMRYIWSKPGKALKLLEELEGMLPNDLWVRDKLARVYIALGRHDEAIELLKELLKADPGNREYCYLIAGAAQNAGREKEIIQLLEGLADEHPSPHLFESLGNLLSGAGEWDRAVEAYRRGVELNPTEPWPRVKLTDLLVELGRVEEAEAILVEGLKAVPQGWKREQLCGKLIEIYVMRDKLDEMAFKPDMPGEFYNKVGDYYCKRGRFEEALKAYEMMADSGYTPFGGAEAKLMRCYAAMGRHRKAAKLFREMLMAKSPDGYGWMCGASPAGYELEIHYGKEEAWKAFLNAYEGIDLVEAAEALEEVMGESPDELGFMGFLYMKAGQFDRAAEIYQRAIELQPGEVKNLYRFAAALNRGGKRDGAELILRRARKLLPAGDALFTLYLALICEEGRLYEEAISLYERALDMDEMKRQHLKRAIPFCLQQLGKLYLITGGYDKAMGIYERMLASGYELGGVDVAWRMAVRYGDLYDEAIRRMRERARAAPRDPKWLVLLARVCVDKGDLSEAEAALKEALRIDPEDGAIHIELGEVYLREGKAKAAKEEYLKGLALLGDWKRELTLKRLISTCQELKRMDVAVDILLARIASAEGKGAIAADKLVEMIDEASLDAIVETLEPYLKEHGDGKAAMKLLARAYLRKGEKEKAEAIYMKWVALEDPLTAARELVERGVKLEMVPKLCEKLIAEGKSPRTRLAEAHMLLREYDQAIELLREEVKLSEELSPGLSSFYGQLLWLAERTDDVEGFERFCRKLAEMSGEAVRMSAHLALSIVRRRIGDEAGAREELEKAGLIDPSSWRIIGPFESPGVAGLDLPYPPEKEYLSKGGIDLDGECKWFGRRLRWRRYRPGPSTDIDLSFLSLSGWEVAYAYAEIGSPEERTAKLGVAKDDEIKVWINGEEVCAEPRSWGMWGAVDQHIVPVKLKAGRNTVLVKIVNRGGGFSFRLRILPKHPNGKLGRPE